MTMVNALQGSGQDPNQNLSLDQSQDPIQSHSQCHSQDFGKNPNQDQVKAKTRSRTIFNALAKTQDPNQL